MTITFLGSKEGSGVKTVAKIAAQHFAATHPDKTVLYLCAYSSIPDFANIYTIESIKEFDKDLENKLLVRDNFYAAQFKGLYDEDKSDLNTLLESNFDVVFVAAGNALDSGSIYIPINLNGNTYLVLENNESSFRLHEWKKVLYDRLRIKFRGVIINKYPQNPAYDLDYISERLGIDKFDMFPFPVSESADSYIDLSLARPSECKDPFVTAVCQFVDKGNILSWKRKANEEYFHKATVRGKEFLFTDIRIDRRLPEGVYLYEVRESDEGYEPCEISQGILVNFYGTLISKEPITDWDEIDKNGRGFLYLKFKDVPEWYEAEDGIVDNPTPDSTPHYSVMPEEFDVDYNSSITLKEYLAS